MQANRRWLLALLAVTASDFSSCDFSSDSYGTPGVKGQAKFRYVCQTDYDPACSGGLITVGLPAAVAVGSTFGLEASSSDGESGSVAVESVLPGELIHTAGGYMATGAGYVALLAREELTGHVLDFQHLEMVAPTAIGVSSAPGLPPLWATSTLSQGTQLEVVASAQTSGMVDLAGTLSAVWSSSDGSVVTLINPKPGPAATIRAVAPGKATIMANVAGIVGSVEIIVTPVTVTNPPDAGSTEDTGSEMDAGSVDVPDYHEEPDVPDYHEDPDVPDVSDVSDEMDVMDAGATDDAGAPDAGGPADASPDSAELSDAASTDVVAAPDAVDSSDAWTPVDGSDAQGGDDATDGD